MDSSTTIELSTRSPMPSVMPPSDMMFREIPETNMRKNVATTETWIEIPMMIVDFKSRKKSMRIKIASPPPMNAVCSTSVTDWLI